MPKVVGAFTQKVQQGQRALPGLIAAVVLIASAQAGIAQPMLDYESVSLINLIATPERYDKKKVVVAGWITLDLENMSLCVGKEVPSGKECVWVEFEDGTRNQELFARRLKQWRQHNGKVVVVHAVFDKDNHGHLGGWSGGLEKIERITALQRKPANSSQ